MIYDLSRDPSAGSLGLTGGTLLNTNYSIISSEISLYPEISILLQIVRIIHKKNQIKPESER